MRINKRQKRVSYYISLEVAQCSCPTFYFCLAVWTQTSSFWQRETGSELKAYSEQDSPLLKTAGTYPIQYLQRPEAWSVCFYSVLFHYSLLLCTLLWVHALELRCEPAASAVTRAAYNQWWFFETVVFSVSASISIAFQSHHINLEDSLLGYQSPIQADKTGTLCTLLLWKQWQ